MQDKLFLKLTSKIEVIILAAGKSERMSGSTPKVILKVLGKPILVWVLETLKRIGFSEVNIVLCHKPEVIINKTNHLRNKNFGIKYITTQKALGTAFSLKFALRRMKRDTNYILVLYGDDSALYNPNTIFNLVEETITTGVIGKALAIKKNYPTSLGSLKIDEEGNILGVEGRKEMIEKKIRTNFVLCGAFCFDRKWISNHVGSISINSASGEYPLPAIFRIAQELGTPIKTCLLKNQLEWNSNNNLRDINIIKRKMIAKQQN